MICTEDMGHTCVFGSKTHIKWLDSEYILSVKLTRYANRLDVGCERKSRIAPITRGKVRLPLWNRRYICMYLVYTHALTHKYFIPIGLYLDLKTVYKETLSK